MSGPVETRVRYRVVPDLCPSIDLLMYAGPGKMKVGYEVGVASQLVCVCLIESVRFFGSSLSKQGDWYQVENRSSKNS